MLLTKKNIIIAHLFKNHLDYCFSSLQFLSFGNLFVVQICAKKNYLVNIPINRTLLSPLPSKQDEILNFDRYLEAEIFILVILLLVYVVTFPRIVAIMSPNLSVVIDSKLPNHANPIIIQNRTSIL